MNKAIGILVVGLIPPALALACGRGQPPVSAATDAASQQRATETSASAPTRADCNRWLAEGDQGYATALASVSKTCSSDTDCETADSSCRPSCGSGAVAKREHDRFVVAVREGKRLCDQFWERGCMAVVPIAVPSCPAYDPRCVGGTCTAAMRTR